MNTLFISLFGCLQKRQPFFFVLSLVLLIGCTSEKEEYHRDYEILFSVNGIERTVFDFETDYVEYLIKTGRNDTKNERYKYLNEIIDKLLLAQAGTEAGLLDHPTYLGAVYYQERKSMLDFYFIDEMGELLDPLTDEELRLAFAKRQRKVYVRHLYSQDPSDLEIPYQRLLDGENFIDVANDFYQTEVYDSLAGFIGPISYFGVDDAFADAAYSTNLNEFTEPIRSQLGYHIIYVEYIEFPAMITEDEYQYRKEGVRSQLRLRNQQLVSNDYVQTLMEGLNVNANGENISELMNVIANLDGDAIISTEANQEDMAVANWTDERIEQLKAAYDPEAILASFDDNGVQKVFTFADYLNWLPYLSFQESKVRTGASVGRALRNEVIYQFAAQENYSEDDRVIQDVKKRGYDILAELHQYNLFKKAIADTTKIEVPNSYRDRLIRNRYVLLKADYWKIAANDLEEAENIKKKIEEGTLPISYDSYQEFQFSTVEPSNSDFRVIRQALENRPLIGYSAENGWFVLNLNRREITEVSNSTESADIEMRYKVFSTINSEIEQLRQQADIQINTELFDEIYEVWRTKNEVLSEN